MMQHEEKDSTRELIMHVHIKQREKRRRKKKAELEHLLNREQIADAFEFRILLLRLHDVLPLRYHIRFGD
jgi:hypothetical protein